MESMVRGLPNSFQHTFSRRSFLHLLGSVGGLVLAPSLRLESLLPSAIPSAPFEEVASSFSGITWTHVSGRSPMAHLPETVGAGCAFFDYDNDGWMDIYLVNSGPCDFYQPSSPLRNALTTTIAMAPLRM